jgi:hypothetical protein
VPRTAGNHSRRPQADDDRVRGHQIEGLLDEVRHLPDIDQQGMYLLRLRVQDPNGMRERSFVQILVPGIVGLIVGGRAGRDCRLAR